MRSTLFFSITAIVLGSAAAFSQDAVKADPAHFKVEVDNAQVRVIRYSLAPGEKTVAHEHLLPHVEVQLTDSTERTTIAGGKSESVQNKAGSVDYEGIVGPHVNENVGKTPVSTIVVELKSK